MDNKRKVCQRCGYVHGSDDARVLNRFSGIPSGFIAKHGDAQRHTREQAEYDECTWRVTQPSSTVETAVTAIALQTTPAKTTNLKEPFPAALMEVAAPTPKRRSS